MDRFTELPDGSFVTEAFPKTYNREEFYEELQENNREVDREISFLNKANFIAEGIQ